MFMSYYKVRQLGIAKKKWQLVEEEEEEEEDKEQSAVGNAEAINDYHYYRPSLLV